MADDRRELDRVAWRRLRARVLREEPFCLDCDRDGLTTRAVEVDHVDGNPANNSLSNLRPLCKSHHSRKTRSSGYNYRGQGENKLK
jgi:5-methylcytosine-specific restriction protein A